MKGDVILMSNGSFKKILQAGTLDAFSYIS